MLNKLITKIYDFFLMEYVKSSLMMQKIYDKHEKYIFEHGKPTDAIIIEWIKVMKALSDGLKSLSHWFRYHTPQNPRHKRIEDAMWKVFFDSPEWKAEQAEMDRKFCEKLIKALNESKDKPNE